MDKQTFVTVILLAITVVGILGVMYAIKFLNAATLQTQIITPKDGMECVVVSASDSTSVYCWRVKND